MKLLSFRSILMPASAGLLAACLSDSQVKGGHVVENEVLAGTLYTENGEPAAGARVKAYPVGYVPRSGLLKTAEDSGLVYTGITDKDGRYKIDSLAPGVYNFSGERGGDQSFLDSITIGPRTLSIPSDTLMEPGDLTIITVMEPNHDRRKVFVQVLGTERFASADSSGKIVLEDIAQGRYYVRFSSSEAGYEHYFTNIVIRSGKSDIHRDTIRLVFTGVPIVKGLKAAFDTTTGLVTLSWYPTAYGFLEEYLVYRTKASDLLPPVSAIGKTQDTFFVDSLAPLGAGSTIQAYEYRVRIHSKSDDTGPVFGSSPVNVVPHTLIETRFTFGLKDNPHMQVGVKDSVAIVLQWSNPTRQVRLVQWRSADNMPISAPISTTGRQGSDTLRTRLPAQPGSWSVSVEAMDDAGEIWRASLKLNILPALANAGADTIVTVSDTVILVGRGEIGFGPISKMEWDIGNTGAFKETGPGNFHMFASATAGTMTNVLRITDEDGNVAQDTMQVIVVNDLPRLNFEFTDRPDWQGGGYTLQAKAIDKGRIVEWEWDIGETGSFVKASGGDTSFVPDLPAGTALPCIVRVTDDDGHSVVSKIQITVSKWNVVSSVVSSMADRIVFENVDYPISICAIKGVLYVTNTASNRIYTYDISTHQWGVMAAPPAHLLLTELVSSMDQLYLVDGNSGGTTIYAFDAALGTWSVKCTSKTARESINAVALADQIFVKGGESSNDPMEEFDLSSTLSYIIPGAVTNDWPHTSMATWAGKLYITSGSTWTEYDPEKSSWKSLDFADPESQLAPYSTVGMNGKIYMFGESNNWVYDIAKPEWDTISQMRYPFVRMGCTTWDGKLYCIGRNGILQSYDPEEDP